MGDGIDLAARSEGWTRPDWADQIAGRLPKVAHSRGPHAPTIRLVGADEALRWRDSIEGQSDRAVMTRTALSDAADMEDYARVYVSEDSHGDLVGAMSTFVYHHDGEGDIPDTLTINSLGSLREGAGVGTGLVRQAVRDAKARGLVAVYVEATPGSRAFYQRLGFTRDPLELGSPFFGLLAQDYDRWLASH